MHLTSVRSLPLWLAMLAISCSRTAGPVRPDVGPGVPVDPTSLPDSARIAAAPARPPVTAPESEPERARPSGPVRGGRAVPVTDIQHLPVQARGVPVRVLVRTEPRSVTFEGSTSWEIERPGDPVAVAAGIGGRVWRIERDGAMLRVVRTDGAATPFRRGALELRLAEANGATTIEGRARYRGALVFHATDAGIQVINHLPMEEYLAGVVPLEIGASRTMEEIAAVEAQAVAARSYTVTRRSGRGTFDLRATTADQVYGGVDAETPVAIRAVLNTRGFVLRYAGRVVNAPYHSTCGGTTAEAPEAWRTGGEPYLQRVSDRIPGTDRDYCDVSPRYRWTKTIDAETLDAAVAQHLASHHRPPPGGFGHVRAVRVAGRTASGRVSDVTIETARGGYAVRGNDARTVLRRPGGEILNSSYFSVRGPADARGGVVLEGRGFGHGVGMCQWGAIGRARAGQDYRTILRTYFPGTTVGPA